ncbi:hypothetical protein [Oceanobacillus caeni]|nr:hypothetical protein [Oceanobacillus caeni]
MKSGDLFFSTELVEHYQHQVYQICFNMIGNREVSSISIYRDVFESGEL